MRLAFLARRLGDHDAGFRVRRPIHETDLAELQLGDYAHAVCARLGRYRASTNRKTLQNSLFNLTPRVRVIDLGLDPNAFVIDTRAFNFADGVAFVHLAQIAPNHIIGERIGNNVDRDYVTLVVEVRQRSVSFDDLLGVIGDPP